MTLRWVDSQGNRHWDDWPNDRWICPPPPMPCSRGEDHEPHVWDSEVVRFGPYRCPGKINPGWYEI